MQPIAFGALTIRKCDGLPDQADSQSGWKTQRCQCEKRFAVLLASLSGLPARAKGGLEMTQSNQIKKNDDFKLVIVFRIEGKNSRAIVLRFVGIFATIVAIGIKVVTMFMGRAP